MKKMWEVCKMADADDRELLRLLIDDPEAGVRGLMDRYGSSAAPRTPKKRLPMHWLPPGGKRAGCWRRKSRCCPG